MFLTDLSITDKHDKNWCWNNYLSARALMQAENVRSQLLRTMERYEIDLVTTQDERRLWTNIRKALVCGFFMQVARKEGKKNAYLTVKDNQVGQLHPSCGLDTSPEWIIFNEFVLTTRPYIRTVTEVRPEWCVYQVSVNRAYLLTLGMLGCWNTHRTTTTCQRSLTER